MARWFYIPAAPLIAYVEARGGIYSLIGDPSTMRSVGTEQELADFYREETRYKRARARGKIDLFAADAFCIDVLCVHPAAVWGDDWFEFSPDVDNLAAPVAEVAA